MKKQLAALALAAGTIGSAIGAQSMSGPIGTGSGRGPIERHVSPPPRPAPIVRAAPPPVMPAPRVVAQPAPRPAPPIVVQAPRPPIVSATPPAAHTAPAAPVRNEPKAAMQASAPAAAVAKPLALQPPSPPAPVQPPAVTVKGHATVVQGKLSTTGEYGDANKAVRVNVVTDKENRIGRAEADVTLGRANRTQYDAGATIDEGKLSRASAGFRRPNGDGGGFVVWPQPGGVVDWWIQYGWGY